MTDDMGTLLVALEIENPARPGESREVGSVLVDTGAGLSWILGEVLESLGITRNSLRRLRQADGAVVDRWVGSAIVRVSGRQAGDEVVFGQPGDMTVLGARSLTGLNLRVDPAKKQLVDAGPAPAAVAA